MSKYIKVIVFLLVVVLLAAGGIILLKKRKQQLANLPKPEKPIYVVKGTLVKKGAIEEKRQFLGKITPDKLVNISTKYPGYIKKLYVSENTKVKKGQLILSIDPQPIKKEIENLKLSIQTLKAQLEALLSQKEALKTAYKTAQNIYLRNKKLYQKKAIPKEALEQSYSNYKKAEAQYKQTLAGIKELQAKISQTQNQIKIKENQLSYLEIKSPIDGVVSKVFLKEGNLAPAGKPVLQLQTEKRFKILVQYPQNLPVKEKTKAVIKTENKQVLSYINKIYPSAEKNNLFTAEIILENLPDNLKVNSLVNVDIYIKKAEGFIVPNNAILHLTDGDYVLTQKEESLEKIPVKVIAQDEKYSVIEGNIHEGMLIAIGDESKLRLLSVIKKGKIIK